MKIKKRSSLHILIVAGAVVLFWRGAWGLMDLYIFPDHALYSYITSILFGVIVLMITRRLEDELS